MRERRERTRINPNNRGATLMSSIAIRKSVTDAARHGIICHCNGLSADEREIAKHTHDLSRNIWLAMVAILGYVIVGKV